MHARHMCSGHRRLGHRKTSEIRNVKGKTWGTVDVFTLAARPETEMKCVGGRPGVEWTPGTVSRPDSQVQVTFIIMQCN